MKKFTIDERYNYISINLLVPADQCNEMLEWCDDRSTRYDTYTNGVQYREKSDLTAFLLRWL